MMGNGSRGMSGFRFFNANSLLLSASTRIS